MATEQEMPKGPRARLFVALDLPAEVRAGIAAWGRRQLRDPALRPVRQQSLHVTLAFLGWRAEEQIPRLAEIVAASGAPAPWLALGGPVGRPEHGRPRLFALSVESPATVALQAALERRLVGRGSTSPTAGPSGRM